MSRPKRKKVERKASALPLENFPGRCRLQQAAEYLNCSLTHVRNLIEEGALVAVNIAPKGSRKDCMRVLRDSIEAFMKTRSTMSEAGK